MTDPCQHVGRVRLRAHGHHRVAPHQRHLAAHAGLALVIKTLYPNLPLRNRSARNVHRTHTNNTCVFHTCPHNGRGHVQKRTQFAIAPRGSGVPARHVGARSRRRGSSSQSLRAPRGEWCSNGTWWSAPPLPLACGQLRAATATACGATCCCSPGKRRTPAAALRSISVAPDPSADR